MKQLDREQRREVLRQLRADLEAGQVDISVAVRRMRSATGMTQREFAERVAGVSLPTLQRIEAGSTAVRVDTLRKVVRHFGFDVGLVR